MFLPYFKYTIKIEITKKTGGIFSDLTDYTFYTIKINGLKILKELLMIRLNFLDLIIILFYS